MQRLKLLLLGTLLGAILAVTIHLVKQFDKDSQTFKTNFVKPTMVMGDK